MHQVSKGYGGQEATVVVKGLNRDDCQSSRNKIKITHTRLITYERFLDGQDKTVCTGCIAFNKATKRIGRKIPQGKRQQCVDLPECKWIASSLAEIELGSNISLGVHRFLVTHLVCAFVSLSKSKAMSFMPEHFHFFFCLVQIKNVPVLSSCVFR